MKKRFLSLLCVLALCLGLLPVTALAVGGAPSQLYVGDQQVSSGNDITYWTTDKSTGGLTKYEGNDDNWNVKYDPTTVTLTLKNANISGSFHQYDNPYTAGIYAQGKSNQPVALTIELIGTNTITGTYGIFLNAEINADSNGTDASLTITGENNGSLEVSGSNHGIFVKSGTGNASLNIEKATVTSSTDGEYAAGVCVQSGASATDSPNISLSVDGGNLTASGTGSSDGIWFYVGSSQATGATTSLTVSENAIVDARNGGISALKISETLPTPTPTGDNRSGIVFDGSIGTVYGSVTLQDNLEIKSGETLTIGDGASLTVPSGKTLTNNGTVTTTEGGILTNNGTINNSGTLPGTISGNQPPKITTTSLPDGKEYTAYNETLQADNDPTQWSVTSGSLPAELTLDTSTGVISGTPTAADTYNFTVTATNGNGSDSKAFTLTVTPTNNYFEISTAEQLYAFANAVNGGNTTANAVLTADITLDSNSTVWTPIGKDNSCIYNGTFDGQGHTISGLQCSVSSGDVAGLFGVIGSSGVVKNVGIADSDVSVVVTVTDKIAYAGGVCGYSAGTVENCWNSGSVTATCNGSNNDRNAAYAGGVCGWNDGIIRNCWNSGAVKAESTTASCVGGVCGYNTGTITNCYWLAGTAEYGIGNPRGDTNAESKTAEQFASGEVAWLLNQGQTGTPWGQGSNGMPVLEGNLPAGVTSKTPVRITIVMPDNTTEYRYTTAGSTVPSYPTGYAFFFEDGNTQTWINKGTQTYDSDATIYAENMTLEKIPAKAATCTEKGNSEYWYCENYDKYFSDENGVNEITAKDTVIPATGHGESEVKGAKEATCTEDGYTGDKVCKVCGEILEKGTVIEKFGHVWGEPEWNWSEDGTSCTVTFTCKNNPEHKETPEADVTSEVKTPATCTESGVTTYTATVELNGKTYTDTKDVADIPATGHSYDNGKCTVCGAIASDFKVIITAGANGSWQKGTKDGLTFTSNAAYKHFQKVQVDGKDLDASNYTVKEGSTIVNLKTEYLETLSVGKHTLAIVSETGTATTEFTVKAAAVTDDTQSPQTGDDSNIALWIAVLLAAGTALTGTAVYSRKRKYSK